MYNYKGNILSEGHYMMLDETKEEIMQNEKNFIQVITIKYMMDIVC